MITEPDVPVIAVAGQVVDLELQDRLVVETYDNMALLDQACQMMSEIFLLVRRQGPTFSL